jgi:hypothetical protein
MELINNGVDGVDSSVGDFYGGNDLKRLIVNFHDH